jgi:hypothetical protein
VCCNINKGVIKVIIKFCFYSNAFKSWDRAVDTGLATDWMAKELEFESQ